MLNKLIATMKLGTKCDILFALNGNIEYLTKGI